LLFIISELVRTALPFEQRFSTLIPQKFDCPQPSAFACSVLAQHLPGLV